MADGRDGTIDEMASSLFRGERPLCSGSFRWTGARAAYFATLHSEAADHRLLEGPLLVLRQPIPEAALEVLVGALDTASLFVFLEIDRGSYVPAAVDGLRYLSWSAPGPFLVLRLVDDRSLTERFDFGAHDRREGQFVAAWRDAPLGGGRVPLEITIGDETDPIRWIPGGTRLRVLRCHERGTGPEVVGWCDLRVEEGQHEGLVGAAPRAWLRAIARPRTMAG